MVRRTSASPTRQRKPKEAGSSQRGSVADGLTRGAVQAAATDAYLHTIARSGPVAHGVLAEQVNTWLNRARGISATHLGADNAFNGPDRLVEGLQVQTKYFRTGAACIQACFDSISGEYRYFCDGELWRPMLIEVPRDMYRAAVRAMRRRIEKGQVLSVEDPAMAEQLVVRGELKYEQARNLARAGRIESVTYDVLTGAVTSGCVFGLTAAVRYAEAIWSGDAPEVATNQALRAGAGSAGAALMTRVLSAQLARTGLERRLLPASEAVVGRLGSKTARALAATNGRRLAGAAAKKHAAKLLRGNAVAAVASSVVLSAKDVYRLADGSISGGQALKNVSGVVAGVTAGSVGWTAGAAAGAALGSVMPGPGTAVGAVVGGLVGSTGLSAAASNATAWALGHFVEDDAPAMLAILRTTAVKVAVAHRLTEAEAVRMLEDLTGRGPNKLVRAIHRSADRVAYCHEICDGIAVGMTSARTVIALPSAA